MPREDTVSRIFLQKARNVEDGKISALLIEGDTNVTRLIGKIAGQTKSGRITVDHVRSVPEGLARLSTHNVDVVILSLLSPDANGSEAVGRIITQSPHVPIIILSDDKDDHLLSAYSHEVVHDVLTRADITTDRLIGAVRSASAHKRGAEEAMQSAERLRTLFWGIPIPTYIWKHEDDDFVLSDYNNAALTITEGKITDFVGQSVARMYGDLPEIVDDMHRCYHERGLIKKEILYHFQTTGRDRYLEVTYGFVPPDLVIVHTVDITERKEAVRILRQFNNKLEATVREQTARLTRVNEELEAEIKERAHTEEALTESERKYRLLVENASEGITVSQRDRIAYANTRAITTMGYSFEELTTRNLMDFVHPDDRVKVLDYHMRGLAGENPPPMTYRIVNRDGKVIWTEVNGVLIEWDGQPSGLVFYKDVTDRIKAQDALRESEEKYRLVVENANEGIIISQATHMRFVNPKVVQELGYTQEELISRPFVELIHPDDRDMVIRHHLDGIAGKKVDPTISYRVFDRNGTIKWIEVNGVTIIWEGEPCVLLFLKDITDRKRTEEALRESEEKYRLVVENANEGIVINQDGFIRFANDRLCEITGYTREELISRPFTDVIHPDERTKALSRYREMIEGKAIELPYPYRIVDKAGNVRWIEVNSIHVSWQGRPAVLVFVDDVTQRKQHEDALKHSEQRYRELVENTGDLVYIMDGEGNFQLINQTIGREYGYTAADLVGKGFKDIITPQSYGQAVSIYRKQLKGMDVGPFELDLYDKSGQIRTVETRERLVRTGKRVTEVHGIARDVTDRKRAEKALRESEEKYRSLVENINDAICSTDLEGRVSYVSPVVEQIIGYSVQEIVGRPITDFIYPEDLTLFIESYRRTLDGKKEPLEFRAIHKNGNIIHVRTFSRRVFHDGALIGLTGTITDVTERIKAEDALRESEEKYRLVVENAEESITIAVGDHLVFANRKALELSGYSQDEATTIPVIEMIHPDDRQMVLKYRSRRGNGEKGPQSFIMRLVKKDGQPIWFQNSVVPVFWEGKPAALNVATDITERKWIEDALKESEEKYRLVVQNADEVIIVAVDGYLQLFNMKTFEVFGYTEDELRSTPVIEFFHPDDRDLVLRYRKKRERGKPQHQFFTARMVKNDGSTVWMQCSVVPFPWRGKTAALVIANNVTEHKRIEDALKESEEKYRLVVENAGEMVTVSVEGVLQFVNRRTISISGYSEDELLWTPVIDLVHPDDRHLLIEHRKERGRGEKAFRPLIIRNVAKDGTIVWTENNIVPVLWQGKPAALNIASDITERKRIEDALRESEEKYRLVVENANEIIVISRNGIVKFANKRVTSLFGIPPEALLGKHLSELVVNADRERLRDEYQKLSSGEGSLPFYRYRMRDAKGDIRFIEVSGITIAWDGQPAILSFVSDITGKVRAEEEIKRRLRYEQAVALCSQELVRLSDLDASMGMIVRHLLESMDVGGVFICKNVMDPVEGLCMQTVSEVIDNEHKPPVDFPVPDKVPYHYRSQEMLDALKAGRPFGGPTKDYPPIDRNVLALIGSQSSLMIPIAVGGQFWGFIGFDDFKTERVWDEQDTLLLQTISSMIGTAVARQEAQKALVESERRYREVVDGTNDIIYVMDYRGNFRFVNNAARQLGYEPEEIIGRNIYEFYAPSSMKYAQELFRLQRAGAQLSGYELDIIRKDGQVRTFEFRDDLKWEEDRIIEVRGIGRDVTDRKKREDRLRLVAESQEAVLDSLPDMVFFTDLGLKITWANRAASRLTGSSVEEMVGRFCFEVLHQKDAACEGCPAVASLASSRTETNDSIFCFNQIHRITAYPIPDVSGDVTGMAISIGDISSGQILDITENLSPLDDEIEDEHASELFLAPLDPNYIYPFRLSIDFQKDTFVINLRWDEFGKNHLLKRLARSESAVARFIYLAARMKTDGTGWVDKDIIKAGTMDTNLNKLRSLLQESNVPFLDRFSSRMLIRSNKEEKKKVRLAISPSNIEISPTIKNFRSKKHRYLVSVSKKIKKLKHDIENKSQAKEYLVSELAIQQQNEANLKKSIDILETLISEASAILKL